MVSLFSKHFGMNNERNERHSAQANGAICANDSTEAPRG